VTLDELKVELEALAARCDETLAQDALKRGANTPGPWQGEALSVSLLFPRDLSDRPAKGHRIMLSVVACVEPARFSYEE